MAAFQRSTWYHAESAGIEEPCLWSCAGLKQYPPQPRNASTNVRTMTVMARSPSRLLKHESSWEVEDGWPLYFYLLPFLSELINKWYHIFFRSDCCYCWRRKSIQSVRPIQIMEEVVCSVQTMAKAIQLFMEMWTQCLHIFKTSDLSLSKPLVQVHGWISYRFSTSNSLVAVSFVTSWSAWNIREKCFFFLKGICFIFLYCGSVSLKMCYY